MMFKTVSIIFAALLLVSFSRFAWAASGGIDPVYSHAWSEHIGWINFHSPPADVLVEDTKLIGHAWSEHSGWINLHPSNAVHVKNDGSGNLSGHAWGASVGFIDFTGVTIDANGFFHGYAYSPVTGQISFNCSNSGSCSSADFKVRTSWRKTTQSPGGGSGGGGGSNTRGSQSLPPMSFLPSPSPATVLLSGNFATSTVTQKFSDPVARCPYFLTALTKGTVHPEVRLLQSFLMHYGFLLQEEVSNVFDDRTFNAVKSFQLAYADAILAPWGMSQPSGWWYITTRKKANELVDCVTTGTLRVAVPSGSMLNVRAGPTLSSEILIRVRAGETYKYYDQNNGWYYIDYASGKSGWVSGQFVVVTERSGLEVSVQN